MKILHLGFHNGLFNDLQYVSEQLGLNIQYLKFTDGCTKGGALYNISHKRARDAWIKFQNFYNQFDLIITSDTCPISRVFLQNEFKGKLIIWICNRFDYCDTSSNDCNFPDNEYYELLRNAKTNKNVKIFSYTKFEHTYAKIKNVDIGNKIIKPCGFISELFKQNQLSFKNDNKIPTTINKNEMYFVPPYHNDTIMINLSAILTKHKISNYCGKYGGPNDLVDFKGIIHIPYAWSNLSLFEAIQLGIIYFIPSLDFILELSRENEWKFFWSPPYKRNKLHESEWYCKENKNLFIYFSSWNDLKLKVNNIDYNVKKNYIKNFGINHNKQMLEKWKNAFNFN